MEYVGVHMLPAQCQDDLGPRCWTRRASLIQFYAFPRFDKYVLFIFQMLTGRGFRPFGFGLVNTQLSSLLPHAVQRRGASDQEISGQVYEEIGKGSQKELDIIGLWCRTGEGHWLLSSSQWPLSFRFLSFISKSLFSTWFTDRGQHVRS